MSEAQQIDVERVICRLDDIEVSGARGFAIGSGDWPLRGFVVRVNDAVRGFINHCPHAGHPLNLRPHRFLTADSSLILCASHGALFEKDGGRCLAGPCPGERLRAVPLEVIGDLVLLAADADVAALTAEG